MLPRQDRKKFFRGMGCFFVFFLIAVSAVIVLAVGKIAEYFGWVTLPIKNDVFFPLTVGIFIVFLFIILQGGRRFFRTTKYINEVLKAADRLAEGEYHVRVKGYGPPALRSLGAAFNKMAGRLEENDQIKRNQLADVAHELRTPLTVIQGNLEAMLDGVYEANPEHLTSLFEETEVMAHLLDDLRTLALAESGALVLQKEPTDLVFLLNDLVQNFQEKAAIKQISLTLEPYPDLPLINLSAVRIREVFSNLLTNAMRHTPSGGKIVMRIGELEEGKESQMLSITVEDTGEGIAEQDLEHIFERFYKASDSGGMGLGLSIAKRLVEAHGGTISAFSEAGQGTKMVVTLPLGEDAL